MVKLLLEHKASADPVPGKEYSARAVYLCIWKHVYSEDSHDGIVRAILEHGANLNVLLQSENFPLFEAIRLGPILVSSSFCWIMGFFEL